MKHKCHGWTNQIHPQRGDKYKKQMKHKSSTPQILSPLLINHNISIQGNHINAVVKLYFVLP